MTFEAVRDAYGARASEYIDVVGRIEHATELDRNRIVEWARGVEGPILDVGSGPGQWTDHLRRQGVDIEGVEPVPEFLHDARRRYPDTRFREGRAETLEVPDAGLGGILAWFSMIHTDPDHLGDALAEFARVLAPGGSLLIGFFTGSVLESFSHAVTTAYYWPVGLLSERIESAGFTVCDRRVSAVVPGRRPEATIVATRMGTSTADDGGSTVRL